jgi:hypothetical protein
MDTLLFVFTTDGGDRESASVFYARYLLVAGNSGDRAAIGASIAKLVGGRVSSGEYILHPYMDDAPIDNEALVSELALEGWQARWATVSFVVEEE